MKPFHFLQELFVQFYRSGSTSRAASLSYTSLLALAPLVAVSLSIFSLFPAYEHFSVTIQDIIFNNFVPSSGNTIQKTIQHIVAQTTNLSIIGTIFLLFTAVLMVFNMESAFNEIWQVEKNRKRIYGFFIYWATIMFAPVLLTLGLILEPYLQLISTFLPLLVSASIFSFFYIAIPNCHVPTRNGIIAGFITAILFECAKKIFVLYLFYFPTYNLLYGALAIIPIFLTWLYIAWLIILFGAFMSYALSR